MTIFFRYATAEKIPKQYFKDQRELSGIVISAGDGDGFRLYHQPLLSCSPPNVPYGELDDHTIRVRLAGIDAPEMGHHGRESQPFALEARNHLQSTFMNKTVIIKLHGLDQYGRVVASAYVRRCCFFKKNLSLELVSAGLASVYTGQGAHYGGIKDNLLSAQVNAKKKKKGIWSIPPAAYKSPADYKSQYK